MEISLKPLSRFRGPLLLSPNDDRATASNAHAIAGEAETEDIASRVYDYVWQRSASGQDLAAVGS